MTLNTREKVAKDMKNIIMKNAPEIARVEQRMYVLKVIQAALEAGISRGSYQNIIMGMNPEYYEGDEAARDRLIRVWNGRQVDFDIIDQIKEATSKILNS